MITVLAAPPFNTDPKAIAGVTKLQTIIGYTAWAATAVCMIGLIVAGASMAIAHQRGSSEAVGRLGGVVAGCLIVGAAAPIAGSILGFNLFTANPEAIPGLGGVQTIISYASWVAAAVCLIGLIIAGAMLALSYRHGDREHAGRLGSVIAGCLIVGGAGTLIGALI